METAVSNNEAAVDPRLVAIQAAITTVDATPLARERSHEEWSAARKALIIRTYCQGATEDEAELFLRTCQRLRLSPEAKQIWSVPRKAKNPVTGRYESKRDTMVSIDGFRLVAERTGEYGGQTPIQWCGPDGQWVDVWLDTDQPWAARVGVIRKGWAQPLYRVALCRSYVQDAPLWRKMPEHMIAKVAEALALRAAFPMELSGVYTDDEMGQAYESEADRNSPQSPMDGVKASAERAQNHEARIPAEHEGEYSDPEDWRSKTEPIAPIIRQAGHKHMGEPASVLDNKGLYSVVRTLAQIVERDKDHKYRSLPAQLKAMKEYAATRGMVDFSKPTDLVYPPDQNICMMPGKYKGQDIYQMPADALKRYLLGLRASEVIPNKEARIDLVERRIVALAEFEAMPDHLSDQGDEWGEDPAHDNC